MKQTETKANLKRDGNYARVDDEATLILTYPGRTGDHSGILELARPSQGLGDLRHARLRLHSGRKERPYAPAGQQTDRAVTPEGLPEQYNDGFAYLAAVVRGTKKVADTDRSSLANNLTVVRILDVARRSARTRQTLVWW
jgi:hypothetical protein